MATIALLGALTTGGAYAAGFLTSVNIKNGSLKNNDFKNKSLTTADLSASALASLVGAKGDTGFPGSNGDMGDQGQKGPDGDPGDPAKLTSSWAWIDTGLMTDSSQEYIPPNPTHDGGYDDWDDLEYGTGTGEGVHLNLRTPAAYTPVNFGVEWTPVMALEGVTFVGTGQSGESQGLITLPWDGRLSATATISMLHRRDGEDFNTNDPATGTLRNGRLQCKVAYGTGSDFSTFTTMGAQTYLSSSTGHEIIDITVLGDANTLGGLVPDGAYNVAVLCRDVDYTGNPQWSLVNANMTTYASG